MLRFLERCEPGELGRAKRGCEGRDEVRDSCGAFHLLGGRVGHYEQSRRVGGTCDWGRGIRTKRDCGWIVERRIIYVASGKTKPVSSPRKATGSNAQPRT